MNDAPGGKFEPHRAVRYHAMDALRGAAMLLGIVLHACMSFADFPFELPWPEDRHRNHTATGAVLAIHLFRLQLFFLVAGFFARMLHERRGTVGFLIHRAQRVGLPLVLGTITLVPLVGLAMILAIREPDASIRGMLRERLFSVHVEMAHLWFLYFLLIYYVLAVGVFVPASAMVRGRARAWLDRGYAMLIRSPLKPAALAPLTMAAMYFSASWHTVGLATQPLVPPHILIYYGIFFAVGWWLHRHVHLLETLKRFKWTYLVAAVICFGVIVALTPYEPRTDHPHYAWIEMAALGAANLYTWSAVFGVMGVFLACLDVSRWYIRYLADASYWFYLAHLPIVVALQALLADYAAPVWVKLGIILGVTLAVLFVTYEYAVRYTWVGTMLNGRRERPGAPRAVTAQG